MPGLGFPCYGPISLPLLDFCPACTISDSHIYFTQFPIKITRNGWWARMLKRDSVKRDQNFEGMWVRPEFSDEKTNRASNVKLTRTYCFRCSINFGECVISDERTINWRILQGSNERHVQTAERIEIRKSVRNIHRSPLNILIQVQINRKPYGSQIH